MERATYEGAARIIRSVLDQEKLIGLSVIRRVSGSLMTMHKSKGREFDGVVMVESIPSNHFLLGHEAPGVAPSRRLLRFGITRARSFVLLVRPSKAKPLVEG